MSSDHSRLLLSLAFVVLMLGCGSNASAPNTQASTQPRVRTYYIAADEVTWDYTPMGIDEVTGKPFGVMESVYVVSGPHRIGHLYRKAIYREYTDGSFKTLKPRSPSDRYLGLLGPIIHAEVGDTVKVVFKNNSSRPYSIHPHGVLYKKDSEGVAYHGTTSADKIGGAVPPGTTYTYTWEVPERAGPGPNDPSSVVWFYHSHVDDQKDTESGLIGALIVTARGMAKPDGTPKDVDREFVTLFDIFNENQSWYLQHNIDAYAPLVKGKLKLETLPEDEQGDFTFDGSGFVDTNFKSTINGYLYGNGPIMTMKLGDRVRWYVLAFGNGFNFHTPHWHGNTVLAANQRTDVLNIAPAQMMTVDMVPDNPGTWLYHCHVSDHMHSGMSALYQVDP